MAEKRLITMAGKRLNIMTDSSSPKNKNDSLRTNNKNDSLSSKNKNSIFEENSR